MRAGAATTSDAGERGGGRHGRGAHDGGGVFERAGPTAVGVGKVRAEEGFSAIIALCQPALDICEFGFNVRRLGVHIVFIAVQGRGVTGGGAGDCLAQTIAQLFDEALSLRGAGSSGCCFTMVRISSTCVCVSVKDCLAADLVVCFCRGSSSVRSCCRAVSWGPLWRGAPL